MYALSHLHEINSWHSPLVWHLQISWWSTLYLSPFDPCTYKQIRIGRTGTRDWVGRPVCVLTVWATLVLAQLFNYRPQRSCDQGNIFAPVCHSIHRGGVCLSAWWDTIPLGADTPRRRHPPEQTPPWEQTPAYGQWAAGTHPTGMHSCWLCYCNQTSLITDNKTINGTMSKAGSLLTTLNCIYFFLLFNAYCLYSTYYHH